eukprot:COSAG02_NODE_1104_length_14560_cov_5.927322_8_plen_86_part_00
MNCTYVNHLQSQQGWTAHSSAFCIHEKNLILQKQRIGSVVVSSIARTVGPRTQLSPLVLQNTAGFIHRQHFEFVTKNHSFQPGYI